MRLLSRGDIVFARFPYEEDAHIKKPRPCLVLAVDNENKKFLAAKITTTRIDRSWAVYIKAGDGDMASGSIRFDSWIDMSRREWIPFEDFIFHVGVINSEKLKSIIDKEL